VDICGKIGLGFSLPLVIELTKTKNASSFQSGDVAMTATMAIKLIERNARVYVKFTTRTTTDWLKASESESEKQ